MKVDNLSFEKDLIILNYFMLNVLFFQLFSKCFISLEKYILNLHAVFHFKGVHLSEFQSL